MFDALVEKLIELATFLAKKVLDSNNQNPNAKPTTIRNESRPEKQKKETKPKKANAPNEEMNEKPKPEAVKRESEKPRTGEKPKISESQEKVLPAKMPQSATLKTPKKEEPQINLSLVKTALNAEALSGNQFQEFWDDFVNAGRNHDDSAKQQMQFDRLKNELTELNQDNKKIKETLAAIKKFLEKPLEHIKADIRGTPGISPKEKDEAFQALNEVPQVQAIRQIFEAIDHTLNPTVIAYTSAPATTAAEAKLPDVRTEALEQQKQPVDLSSITDAFKAIDSWSLGLGEIKRVARKGQPPAELPSLGRVWLNLMNEETPDTAKKAVDYQRLFNENRKSLEAIIANPSPQIEQSLKAMDRFLESFLGDCIDAKEGAFGGNRIKARDGLLERDDMKSFGQLLKSCRDCLSQVSKATSR